MNYNCKFPHRFRRSFVVVIILGSILSFCSGCFNPNTLGEFGNSLIEGLNEVNIFTDEEELQLGDIINAQ